MRAAWMRSPTLTLVLFAGLVASLVAHALRGAGDPAPRRVSALALSRQGEGDRPELWLDFDAPAAPLHEVGRPLDPGLVALDPPQAVEARWLSPRRLALRPRAPLPPFRTFRVRLSGALAAADGRPLVVPDDLSFVSRRFGLAQPPRTVIEPEGAARIDLELAGAPAGPRPLAGVALLDGAGRSLPVRWTPRGDGGPAASWQGLLAGPAPAGGAVLVLPAGLAPAGGGEPLASEERHALAWATALRVSGVSTEQVGDRVRVALAFTHVLEPQALAGLVRVRPAPADLTLHAEDAELWATATFEPGATVRVEVGRGLRAAGGLALADPVERAVRLPRPSPDLRLAAAGGTLSTAAAPELELTGINVSDVEVSLRRVYPNNLVPFALGWAGAAEASAPAVVRRLPIDARPDRPFRQRLDLGALLGERPVGLWHLSVRDPERPWDGDARVLQLTDLAPVARLRPEGLVVWVTRISTGEPVPDVEIAALSASNQLAASGTTDADGLCLLRGPLGHEPRVVAAVLGRESAYVDLEEHAVAHAARDVEGREPAAGLEALVLPDRGVVRPGDTLHADVIVRAPSGEAPPPALPVRLGLLGPDGRERQRWERRAGETGLLTLDLPFPLDAPTGAYRIEVRSHDGGVRLGAGAFRVEALLPDRLEAEIGTPLGALTPGGRVSVPVAARLLGGDPAAGRTARLSWDARPRPARQEEGFCWGDAEAPPRLLEQELGEVVLDDQGAGRVEATLPPTGPTPRALDLTLSLEVLDVSGRASRARLALALPGAPTALGVALPVEGATAFRVRARGADLSRATAVLERVRERGGYVVRGGRSRWRSERSLEELERVEVELVEGAGLARFAEPGEGRFRLRVEAPGAEAVVVGFARWGGRFHADARDDGSPRLPLRLLGGPVEGGGSASLSVEAPFGGPALLTVEGPGVFEAERLDLRPGPQVIQASVPATAAPNVHVALTLVRGQRGSGPAGVRVMGAVCVPVADPRRTLPLTLEAPGTVLPEQPFAVRLASPVACDVRLHVVDEGLLRLTSHPSPDPAGWFAAPRRLVTRALDAYARLADGARYAAEPGEPGGDAEGDAVLAARLDPTARRTVETLGWCSPVLRLEGEARIEVPLPAFEGRVRVVAVAAGRRATGSARADVVVRGPVGLSVHLPRAVAPGDEFVVPLEVRGEGVATAIELEGLTLLAREPALRVRAGDEPGLAAVTVTARDAAGHVVVRRRELPVRPAAPLEVRHEVRRLPAAGTLEVTLPTDVLASTARARLVVGGSGALDLLPALDRLLEYPHGCIEQTVSQAFPLLAFAELARLCAPEGGAPADAVPGAIDRVLSMQTDEGALAAWPGLSTPYPFGSAYGAHFLVEARAGGRAVPEAPLAALLEHLDLELREGRGSAYAAYVLARAGRPAAGHVEGLLPTAARLEERAWLASALVLLGEPARARRLLEGPDDPDAVRPEQGGSLASPLRARATLLQALLAARADDPRIPELAEQLRGAARSARGTTTQENAAALLALARFEARRVRTEGATAGRLVVGGRALPFDRQRAARADLGPGSAGPARVEADGPVTVVVRFEGVPRAPGAARAAPGWSVERRIEGAEGGLTQGSVATVVLTGRVPEGSANLLLTDVLPGGLELEEARAARGSFEPDRVEPRDDRVLFFRTAPLHGVFELRYRVRAVTVGRFAVPPVSLEALYAPGEGARGDAGGVLEVRR